MNCPTCEAPKMGVIESRDSAQVMYRKRECKACGQRVTTVELYSPGNLDAELPRNRKKKEKNT